MAEKQKYPGVTTITSLLSAPYLIKWANNLGLKGIDSDVYVEEAAKNGSAIHSAVETLITEHEYVVDDSLPDSLKKLLDINLQRFIIWKNSLKFEPIWCEKKFISESYKYCGIIDCYCKIDDKYTILDFKTSKHISKEQILQISAYVALLKENSIEVDQIAILDLPKADGYDLSFKTISLEESDKYFQMFLKLLDVYYIKKELGWN